MVFKKRNPFESIDKWFLKVLFLVVVFIAVKGMERAQETIVKIESERLSRNLIPTMFSLLKT